ncbi:hypothetical protein Tco_1205773, partial [Tanacetum coccineum]
SSTRDVSPRLGYPSRRARQRSEAFCRWCVAPLSTLYPSTTSESSLGDSSERPLHSSPHSTGPSCKRCRSPVDSVPSSTPLKENTEIDPIETEVDMELGIGDRNDIRDHVEIDPRDVRDDTKGYKADTSAGDTVEVGIDPMSAPIVKEEIVEPAGEDSSDLSGTRDGIVRSFKDMLIDLDDVVCDFYHHMSEVSIDRIVGIETAQRRLEADQLIARGQRVSMIERNDCLRLKNLKVHAMLDIERGRVNSLRLHMSLSQKEFRQVRRDRDDTRGRLRRLELYVERRLERSINTVLGMTTAAIGRNDSTNEVDAALETRGFNRALISGNGKNGNNGGDNDNGNKNCNVNGRARSLVLVNVPYQEFQKCQPLSCKEQKYATCNLPIDSALKPIGFSHVNIRTDCLIRFIMERAVEADD